MYDDDNMYFVFAGDHYINIYWSGVAIPNSPFHGFARSVRQVSPTLRYSMAIIRFNEIFCFIKFLCSFALNVVQNIKVRCKIVMIIKYKKVPYIIQANFLWPHYALKVIEYFDLIEK